METWIKIKDDIELRRLPDGTKLMYGRGKKQENYFGHEKCPYVEDRFRFKSGSSIIDETNKRRCTIEGVFETFDFIFRLGEAPTENIKVKRNKNKDNRSEEEKLMIEVLLG
jgi:hypothetical protein